MKTIILGVTLLLMGLTPIYTKTSYYFQKLNTINGLSQNCVNTILQDRNGFMWFGTRDGLNRYDGVTFKIFRNDFVDGNGLSNNFITALYEDRDGNIWVGTDIGVYIYYPDKERFEKFSVVARDGSKIERTIIKIGEGTKNCILIASFNSGMFEYDIDTKTLEHHDTQDKYDNVREFFLDADHRLWISFYSGLYFTDDSIKNLQQYVTTDLAVPMAGDVVSKICVVGGTMYLGTERSGVYKVDVMSQKTRKLKLDTNNTLFVRDLILYSETELWVGTESGLYIYNLETESCVNITSQVFDPYSISDNAIYSIYNDKDGGIWIGSFFGGVNYYTMQSPHFNKFYPSNTKGSLQGRRIREICGGENDILWIGTEDAGLFSFNTRDKMFQHFLPSSEFPNIHGLCMDGNELWVATFSHGVKIINTTTGAIRSLTANDYPSTIEDNFVFSIYKDSVGDIYLGTANFMIRYCKQSNMFERIKELDGNLIYDIKEDSYNNMWVATYHNGVFRYDAKDKKWEHFVYTGADNGLPINKILSIFEDSKKNIWLTTQGRGVCRFIPESKTFSQFNSSNGLPNDVVFQIQESNDGILWLTTNKGLVKFDPATALISLYTTADGLLGGQFNYKSSYKDRLGNLYFGTTEGMISFDPNLKPKDRSTSPIYMTDFQLFNKPVTIGQKGSPLPSSITFSDNIKLSHNQNTFSVRITELSYQTSQAQHLVYTLEGFESHWHPLSESAIVSYSNIPHGKYLLRIKRADESEDYEKVLKIEITPPFYLSSLAYSFYLLLFFIVAYQTYAYVVKRTRRKQQLMLDRFEKEKEKELYDAQISFFTNITHEIRTPLTLIKGPLENIIGKGEISDQSVIDDLRIMKLNTDRLHDLTNQLLDFRHVEHNNFILNYVECNISQLLEEVFKRFSSLARQRGYAFTIAKDNDDFHAIVDHEAMTKILSNLFNNALKYGSSSIHVSLVTKDLDTSDFFELQIENDGEVVPLAMRQEIFKPFVRYNSTLSGTIIGTGIGLPLAQFFAEQHGGTLKMDSRLDRNCFILRLPIQQSQVFAVKKDISGELYHEIDDEVDYLGEKKSSLTKTLLVVEDDLGLQAFIKKQLAQDYIILVAANGEEAIELLSQNVVTLVISDIMMPVMNGLELCATIKSDINYSHIPVILLTAKTMVQSKIEGMEVGADAYVEKPFSSKYLIAVINNLIENREKLLKEAFTRYPLMGTSSVAISQKDKELLERIRVIILQNISNADLKMEDIAEMLNMSRASFYRKIKGLLDLSPNEYLRIERLKEAARLLREGEYQISEVCYMVGFNSLSYFSKCFSKQFGILPKDFI